MSDRQNRQTNEMIEKKKPFCQKGMTRTFWRKAVSAVLALSCFAAVSPLPTAFAAPITVRDWDEEDFEDYADYDDLDDYDDFDDLYDENFQQRDYEELERRRTVTVVDSEEKEKAYPVGSAAAAAATNNTAVAASTAAAKTVQTPENTPVSGTVFSKAITAQRQKNDDTRAWLVVPNTNINYPVVFNAESNNYYTQKGYDKKYSYNGVIWAERHVQFGNSSQISKNTTLFGHNWTNPWSKLYENRATDVMFAQLMPFARLSFAQKTPYIYYYTEHEDMVFQVFAVFVCEADNDNFYYIEANPSEKVFANLLSEAKQRSLHNYNVEVTPQDKILTLSTCTDAYRYSNGVKIPDQRFVVMAKLVKDTSQAVNITANPAPKAPQFQ